MEGATEGRSNRGMEQQYHYVDRASVNSKEKHEGRRKVFRVGNKADFKL